MQTSRWTRLHGLVMAAALILGCSVLTSPPTPTPVPTQPPTATAVPATATPVPTNTSLPTPTPTFTATAIPTQSLEEIIAAVMPVTQRRGVDKAAEYEPDKPGIHPIVIIASREQEEWNQNLPAAWVPLHISQTELVAIITYKEVVVEQARYIGKGTGIVFVKRVRVDTEVVIRDAKTGLDVAFNMFDGGEPPVLPKTLPLGTQALYGTSVAYETMIEWLRTYVEK